ncbi:hypothetical protein QFC19_001285 [Naganishia cerealis]|uniref:Uncharacterized protein n=1 Tax=Naganishia cerealis TaxID=610337 RepID=A0ACC2WJ41_9TREE|nr:hypothetical protein QFC19_001285 [Naganishia cerealis]
MGIDPSFPLDPAISSTRSREPPISYAQNDPQTQQQQYQQQQQQQRDWAAMYGNVGAVQQNQIHLSHPPFPSGQPLPSQISHRGSLGNAPASASGSSGQFHIHHPADHASLPSGLTANPSGDAIMTPGSHEGSVGTAGTAPGTAGTISSAGGVGGGAGAGHYRPTTGGSQRSNMGQKGKILYTQPLSISPSSMSAVGGTGGSGFNTSSERSTRHGLGSDHAHGHGSGQYSSLAPHPPHPPQHAPLQVAHPQTAPAYREYGSYLSYERDVHDVGTGPVAASDSGSDDAKKAAQNDKLDLGAHVKGEHEEYYGVDEDGDAQGDSLAEQRAMRNSMALTSILDGMKKDLRAPTTSSERDRHHHHHHHQHGQHSNTEGKTERETGQHAQAIQPHSADYVTQEGSLEARRDHTGTDSGRDMDVGERYNAMDIAERERKLASVLDIGSGGIGGGGPISISLELQGPNGTSGVSNPPHRGGLSGVVVEKGNPGQQLMVPPQQHRAPQPSALATPHTKRSIRGRVGIVDDENRMRQREREHQRLEKERMEGMEDPVTLGILDQDDVAFLFECFHDKFNAYIAILDPALHTPHYVLKTCSILHTAVCTVTAQTYAPEQYKVLLKRVNFMLGKAFERGDQEIGIVQALSILSCWKEPHDKGGWLRLGYAIRMGYELGLDQPPQRPLPKDRLKALEVLNRERTWFQLAAFDRSIFGRRQRMIRTETQHWIEDWITDHPEVYCYADGMLAASYPTGEMIINLRQSTPSYMEDDVGFRVMLHRTRTDIASWRERWFGEQPLAFLHPISAAIIGFYAVAADWEVADFCYRNVPKSRIPEHLADATSKAMKLLRYIVTDLAPGEIMVFAPDVITVRAARSAVFLARLIPQLDPSVVEEIYNIFRDVVRECRRHSRGQNTTYHLAKFFASLIKISSVGPTRSASRLQTPEEGSQEPQATAVSGEALTAKLNEAAEGTSANQDPAPQDFFQRWRLEPSADISVARLSNALVLLALSKHTHGVCRADHS